MFFYMSVIAVNFTDFLKLTVVLHTVFTGSKILKDYSDLVPGSHNYKALR